jgi:NADH-quinone oxidoreductase subunit L
LAWRVAALLTSFYSWRLIFLTFYGKPRWAGSEHIQHAVHHVHEDAGEIASDHDSAAMARHGEVPQAIIRTKARG